MPKRTANQAFFIDPDNALLHRLRKSKSARLGTKELSNPDLPHIIAKCDNLNEIWLNDLTLDNVKIITDILDESPNIKSFKLMGTVGSPDAKNALAYLLNHLKTNDTLEKLDLSESKLKDEQGKQLAKMLKVNTRLLELYLYRSKMGADGAIAILKALETNKTLQVLDLSKFNHDVSISDDKFAKFAKAAKDVVLKNTTLRHLFMNYIFNTYSAPANANALKSDISEALKSNDTLFHLEFNADGKSERANLNDEIMRALKR